MTVLMTNVFLFIKSWNSEQIYDLGLVVVMHVH